MTIAELDTLLTKIKAGLSGMSDVETYNNTTYASKLYEAAREYRDLVKWKEKRYGNNK